MKKLKKLFAIPLVSMSIFSSISSFAGKYTDFMYKETIQNKHNLCWLLCGKKMAEAIKKEKITMFSTCENITNFFNIAIRKKLVALQDGFELFKKIVNNETASFNASYGACNLFLDNRYFEKYKIFSRDTKDKKFFINEFCVENFTEKEKGNKEKSLDFKNTEEYLKNYFKKENSVPMIIAVKKSKKIFVNTNEIEIKYHSFSNTKYYYKIVSNDKNFDSYTLSKCKFTRNEAIPSGNHGVLLVDCYEENNKIYMELFDSEEENPIKITSDQFFNIVFGMSQGIPNSNL